MSLNRQFSIILIVLMLCSLAAAYFTTYFGILSSFEKIEQRFVEVNSIRLMNNIKADVEKIKDSMNDYATWDDAYEFVQNRNQKFIDSTLQVSNFTNLDINVMIFLNKKNDIVYSSTHSDDYSKIALLPDDFNLRILENPKLFKHENIKDNIQGLISINESVYIVASRPITKTKVDGSSSGTLIFMKKVTKEYLHKLSSKIKMDISFYNIKGNIKSSQFPEAMIPQELSSLTKNDVFIKNISSTQIASTQIIFDIYNNPLLLMNIHEKRSIYQEGLKTVAYALGLILIIFMFIFGSIHLFINKRIYLSLKQLLEDISMIGKKRDLEHRVSLSEYKEFSTIAIAINENLELLSKSEKDKKNMQMQVLHTAKLASLGTLAEGISHEMNTPIWSLQSNLKNIKDTLQKENHFNETLNENFSSLFSSLDQIKQIVDGLTTYSKEESEKNSLINIEEVLQESFVLSKGILEKARILLETNISVKDIFILGSSGKFHQMVLNILNNSKDACLNTLGRNGKSIIKISLQKFPGDENSICLSVSDNGTGIQDDILPKIFDPFFTTKSMGEGMGLGLPIVQGIVREMKGKIDVQTKVGLGTTVNIILPIAIK